MRMRIRMRSWIWSRSQSRTQSQSRGPSQSLTRSRTRSRSRYVSVDVSVAVDGAGNKVEAGAAAFLMRRLNEIISKSISISPAIRVIEICICMGRANRASTKKKLLKKNRQKTEKKQKKKEVNFARQTAKWSRTKRPIKRRVVEFWLWPDGQGVYGLPATC